MAEEVYWTMVSTDTFVEAACQFLIGLCSGERTKGIGYTFVQLFYFSRSGLITVARTNSVDQREQPNDSANHATFSESGKWRTGRYGRRNTTRLQLRLWLLAPES